jgi:hypothetical protein
MTRLKKNIQAAPVERVLSSDTLSPPTGERVVDATYKHAAIRCGVPVSTIRTLIKNYGLDAPRMGKYKTVRLADLEILREKLAACDKLNADPVLKRLPKARKWRWEPERKKWGGRTTPLMGPWVVLKRVVKSGLLRLHEGGHGSLPLDSFLGLRLKAQVQPGAVWFRLFDEGMKRDEGVTKRHLRVQIFRTSEE